MIKNKQEKTKQQQKPFSKSIQRSKVKETRWGVKSLNLGTVALQQVKGPIPPGTLLCHQDRCHTNTSKGLQGQRAQRSNMSELHFHSGLEWEKKGIKENETRETRCEWMLHGNLWVEYVVGSILGTTH